MENTCTRTARRGALSRESLNYRQSRAIRYPDGIATVSCRPNHEITESRYTSEDRSKVFDKSFVAESRPYLVLSKFGVFTFQKTRAGGDNTDQESPKQRQRAHKVPSVQEAQRRVRETGTRVSAKRTLSRGVEAARESSPQVVPHRAEDLVHRFQSGERTNYRLTNELLRTERVRHEFGRVYF